MMQQLLLCMCALLIHSRQEAGSRERRVTGGGKLIRTQVLREGKRTAAGATGATAAAAQVTAGRRRLLADQEGLDRELEGVAGDGWR